MPQNKENSSRKVSKEDIAKAIAHHWYVKVGGQGFLLLSGAPSHWKNNPNDVYLPYVRLVGKEQELRETLKSFQLSEGQDEQIMNSGYTLHNYQTSPYYENFVAEIEEYRKSKADKRQKCEKSNVSLVNIPQYLTKIEQFDRERKVDSHNKKSGRKLKSLMEQLNSLGNDDDKVLDVSKYSIENKGKIIKKPSSKSKKQGPSELKIVSDNIHNFEQAMNVLGPEYDKYVEQYVNINKHTIKIEGLESQLSMDNKLPGVSSRGNEPLQNVNLTFNNSHTVPSLS